MKNINEQFFNALTLSWQNYTSLNYKLTQGNLTLEHYQEIEIRFNVKFPESFVQWHKLYFFSDADCSIIRLPHSCQNEPLEEIISELDWCIAEQLIPLGLIPFAESGNDDGSLVFDTRNTSNQNEYPIRVYDHEYNGDLAGLSEIIFSSFTKLLECLTHFLVSEETKKNFEAIADFYAIDPTGAGLTGKTYWNTWIEMLKANDQEFKI